MTALTWWWDDEDYGLLFELFVERFEVRDARLDFGGRYRGPWLLKWLGWLRWRLFRYPKVALDRMTVGTSCGWLNGGSGINPLSRMARSGGAVWDSDGGVRSAEPDRREAGEVLSLLATQV